MLLGDFFYIKNSEATAGSLKITILINKEHKIFEGHFPEIPIVPGVCMMQMVKEIMEQHSGRKLQVHKGDNLKFLAVINPQEHSEIQADIQHEEIEDKSFRINATLFSGTIIFFKLKATLATA